MRDPIQIVILLDLASDNPISLEDVKPHLPDKRDGRFVCSLSDVVHRTPRGQPDDWAACATALSRMVAEARARVPLGTTAHWYVAGRAALSVFAHLGIELSKWAEVTAMNQRPDKQWDVFPLREAAPSVPFFQVRGIEGGEPSEADGRVAVFVATGRGAPRDAIRAFMREQDERLAALIEVNASGEHGGVLDAFTAPGAVAELTGVFARIAYAFPRRSGLALFIAGPATLALMVGRAINRNVLQNIWVPQFDGGSYHPAITLPLRSVTSPELGATSEDQLARRDLLGEIVDEIGRLKARLRPEHLPALLDAAEQHAFVNRLNDIEVARVPGSEAFALSVAERRLSFGEGLLEGLRRAPGELRAKIGVMVFLHELFHFNQRLHSTTYRGIGRAGFVLEEVDYWADVFATVTLARLEIARRGDDGREHARDIVASSVDVVLAGIAAFDQFEQGAHIERLYERRLRRYLIWHLQRVRADALQREDQLWELFHHRLVAELSFLRCQLDDRSDKLVLGARPETELVVALGGRLLRMPRSAIFDPEALLRDVRSFHARGLTQVMAGVRDQHGSVLIPWVK